MSYYKKNKKVLLEKTYNEYHNLGGKERARGKSMSFKIEDDWVYFKYNEIRNKIRELLNGVKVRNDVVYGGSYTKTTVKTFREVIIKLFDGNEIPKEKI